MNLDLYNVIPVSEQWISHSAKLGRMAATRAFHPSLQRFWRGIRVAITNVVASDRRRLYAMLTFHGAIVTHSFGATNTHLVCGAATGGIYNKALALPKNAINIVTPDWVTDCLKCKGSLPCEPYHPRLLKPIEKQRAQKQQQQQQQNLQQQQQQQQLLQQQLAQQQQQQQQLVQQMLLLLHITGSHKDNLLLRWLWQLLLLLLLQLLLLMLLLLLGGSTLC